MPFDDVCFQTEGYQPATSTAQCYVLACRYWMLSDLQSSRDTWLQRHLVSRPVCTVFLSHRWLSLQCLLHLTISHILAFRSDRRHCHEHMSSLRELIQLHCFHLEWRSILEVDLSSLGLPSQPTHLQVRNSFSVCTNSSILEVIFAYHRHHQWSSVIHGCRLSATELLRSTLSALVWNELPRHVGTVPANFLQLSEDSIFQLFLSQLSVLPGNSTYNATF